MTFDISMLPGSSASSLSRGRLAVVEKSIGITFHRDYVDFLEGANGGIPKRQYFFLKGNEKVVERFLSVVEDYKSDPLGIYDIEVVWSQIEARLNDSLLPFASLFAGDFLCFDFSQGSEPSVVLWDHENSEEDTPELTSVASSFLEFLDLLHE
ncbi:SMI1/KNR4 family protein [Pseudoxanthomonas sp. PXM02]|uniref:SMI1/KNR4 family protein n=1 Tax=Pseudoxanthomonas sp. PXM02 TaxID=2769294 RepID=UPI00178350FE|nr:SMI1/KNR4 family protein [Pseudoxanthomonas sp. PXM02]MBD9477438.1 SMI1/KNR4 family protein [Pseudoxanthomonas sp. PXM02]